MDKSRIGAVIGGYRIESVLGRGGMSVVYLASQDFPHRNVAVKVLAPELTDEEGFRERFIRESNAVASVDHPNVIPIYGAGAQDEVLWIAMRYVEGTDLRRLIHDVGVLPLERTVRIIDQVSQALDAAHRRGLVHRDVKPANVLLAENDHAYLTDFGITKRLRSGTGFTGAGSFVGTADYAAPEQIKGDPVDARTDVYALGCVFYECLTGGPPFRRETEIALLYAHTSERPPRPTASRPGLPAAVDEVVAKSMAKRPDRRYATAGELARAIDGLARRDRPTERIPRLVRRAGRNGRSVAVAVAVTLLVVTAAVAAVVALSPGSGTGPSATGSTFAAGVIGFTWQEVPPAQFQLAQEQAMNRVTANATTIVAVGYDRASPHANAAVWTSTSGSNWQHQTLSAGGAPGTGMASAVWDGSEFVAVGGIARPQPAGADGEVWTSSDGLFWPVDRVASAVLAQPGDQGIRRVIMDGSWLVAVGWAKDPPTQPYDAMTWIREGSSWTSTRIQAPGNQSMWGAAKFGEDVIAVGSDDENGTPDAAVWRLHGIQWSQRPDIIQEEGVQEMHGVVATQTGLVAVGWDGSGQTQDAAVWTSADGTTWRRASGLSQPGSQEMVGVLSAGGLLIAYGTSTVNGQAHGAIWLSRDGTHWQFETPAALGGPGLQHIKGMVPFDGRLIAVGDRVLSGDRDAAVWIGQPMYRGSSGTPSPKSSVSPIATNVPTPAGSTGASTAAS